jgi:cyclopropane-fatty-acyl-phospholipid synthase
MDTGIFASREKDSGSFIQKKAETYLAELFTRAGIKINGSRPWDIQIRDSRFYPRVMFGGPLALGESYMDGWWECRALDQFFCKILQSDLDRSLCKQFPMFFNILKSFILNRQNSGRAFQVGEHHYDAGNDLYEMMLDPYMTYSCGYWREADNLNDAQVAKLDLICRKLGLKKGMKLLDIGCGWGSLARYASQHFGTQVVGLTVSEEQVKWIRKHCPDLPIDIRLQDYREVAEHFDAIASVGMFEHVGWRNYRTFMDIVSRCLKPGGLFLLHTIGSNRSVHCCDPWFDKYIFPNGMLPSIQQIGNAIEPYFVMEDWQNLGVDYDKTLMSWYRNFESSWFQLRGKYSERFHRMWRYYLLSMTGGFRARHVQVWQIVLSLRENTTGYRAAI